MPSSGSAASYRARTASTSFATGVGLAATGDLLLDLQRDVLVEFVDVGTGLDRLAKPELATLPAVRWKALNLARLRERDPAKHATQVRALRKLLG